MLDSSSVLRQCLQALADEIERLASEAVTERAAVALLLEEQAARASLQVRVLANRTALVWECAVSIQGRPAPAWNAGANGATPNKRSKTVLCVSMNAT